MTRSGYEVLKNRNTAVDVRGARLQVVGVDDPVTGHHDIGAAYSGVSATATTVVLCHCPEQASTLAERGADLILSGHMHGGQIYVQGITDRIIKRMGRHYRSGFYDIESQRRPTDRALDRGTRLYVTSGVGFSGVRVRSGEGTEAEVALFTLRSAPLAVAA
jgi:predicted MPP superfamily phosphohydrolase